MATVSRCVTKSIPQKDRNTIALAERRVAVDARGVSATNRGWPDDVFARHGSSAQPVECSAVATATSPRSSSGYLETAIVYPFPVDDTSSASPVSDSLDPFARPQAAPKAVFAVNAAEGKKTAIVTGASSGLGLYTTKALVDRGDYHVVMAVRDVAKGEAKAKEPASRRLPHRDGARARPQVRA